MTYSGIVEKYREGIGAFDWPELGINVTKFVLLVQFYLISMLPCFIMSDTYGLITSS